MQNGFTAGDNDLFYFLVMYEVMMNWIIKSFSQCSFLCKELLAMNWMLFFCMEVLAAVLS